MVYPEEFPPAQYIVNLGLAQAAQAAATGPIYIRTDSSVNLLPERYLPRRLPVVPTAVFGVLLLLGALAVSIAPTVGDVESEEEVLLEQITRFERINKISVGRATNTYNDALAVRGQVAGLESQLGRLTGDWQTLRIRLEMIENKARPPSVKIPGPYAS